MKKEDFTSAAQDLRELSFEPQEDMTVQQWLDTVVKQNALNIFTAHRQERDLTAEAIAKSFGEIVTAGNNPTQIAITSILEAQSIDSEEQLPLTKIWVTKALDAGADYAVVLDTAQTGLGEFANRDIVLDAITQWRATHAVTQPRTDGGFESNIPLM